MRICRVFVTVWCAHFCQWLYLVGSGWVPTRDYTRCERVSQSVKPQKERVRACDNIHQSGVSGPLQGLETLEINGWIGPDDMSSVNVRACNGPVGIRSRTVGGASGFPPPGSVSNQQRVKKSSMIRWCGRQGLAGIARCLADCCIRPLLELGVDCGGHGGHGGPVGGPSLQSSRRTLYRREDGLLQFLLLPAALFWMKV